MLTRIQVTNYQSLHSVDLELGRFTCVVGRTNSGKSALTRAIRTLTSNARGDSFITHGERTSVIVAHTERGIVSLSRGAVNEYTTVPSDPREQQHTYTKLGGNVPEEVSEFIGIAAKDPINYAGQFDMPYLLKDSAGEVARTLGELTNVSVIFEAARESNKTRGQRAATLKLRAADLEQIKERAKSYKNLKPQLAAVEEAEQALTEAQGIQTRIQRLDKLAAAHQQASTILSTLTVQSFELPDTTAADNLLTALRRFESFEAELLHHREQLASATQRAAAAVQDIEALEQQYTQLLIEAGTCPTCNQDTKELSHAH